MAVPGTGAGQGGGHDLRVTSSDLTKLAGDLDDMQDHLDKQVSDSAHLRCAPGAW